MTIVIGCDHAGYRLKQDLQLLFGERGVQARDLGADSEEPSDYTDYALAVARAVAAGEAELGVVVCGTGLGSVIAANKIPGIRAVICHDTFSARMSRLHNDANVLCLGARVIGHGLAREVVAAWLDTPFSGEERHCRRLAKIAQAEAGAREALP